MDGRWGAGAQSSTEMVSISGEKHPPKQQVTIGIVTYHSSVTPGTPCSNVPKTGPKESNSLVLFLFLHLEAENVHGGKTLNIFG